MSIEQFIEIMNMRVIITNGHVLLVANIICMWIILVKLRRKSGNTEIRFNVRELAQERELLRQASIHDEEQRRAMRFHHDHIDQVFSDLQDAIDNWEPNYERVDWKEEGF